MENRSTIEEKIKIESMMMLMNERRESGLVSEKEVMKD
jgi:hypothetical protein